MDELGFALKLEPELLGPVPVICRQRDGRFYLLEPAAQPSPGIVHSCPPVQAPGACLLPCWNWGHVR